MPPLGKPVAMRLKEHPELLGKTDLIYVTHSGEWLCLGGGEGVPFRRDRETVGFLGIVGQEVALEESWVMLSVLVLQTGEGVNDVRKGACANHVSTMANFLKVRAKPSPAKGLAGSSTLDS